MDGQAKRAQDAGVFQPIQATGVATGTAWTTARLDARDDANRAAALLSIAWNVPVVVLLEPIAPSEGETLPTLVLNPREPHLQPRAVSIPTWAVKAWVKTKTDANLEAAVLVYHEALKLKQSGHSSFAFAAFVAAFESIGAITEPLDEKCEECGMRMGAGRRFRAAVEQVKPKGSDHYKRLAKGYGDLRSKTVHSGIMHGGETRDGQWMTGNPFVIEPLDRFMSDLALAHGQCRKLLEQLLSE